MIHEEERSQSMNCRLTINVPHLLEKNYKLMNSFFPAVSITILTSTFTNPTMFLFYFDGARTEPESTSFRLIGVGIPTA